MPFRVFALSSGAEHALEQGGPVEPVRPHGGGRWPGDDGSGVVDGAGVVSVKVGQHRHDAVAQAMGRGEHPVLTSSTSSTSRFQGTRRFACPEREDLPISRGWGRP